MRTIGVVTVARSDYGIYRPILKRIVEDPDLKLHLIVAAAHLSPEFGRTATMIEVDGFHIGDRVEMLLSSDSPEGVSKSMGLGLIGFAHSFARQRPDILVVLGDRYEMFSAALAALPFKIPVAHIHGGEITRGAIDDNLRHAMTKLSHLHFVSTEEYARRVIQLGEAPWRVTVSGAPGLDNLKEIALFSTEEIEEAYGIRMSPPPLLATYHPVTLEYERTAWQMEELLAALDAFGRSVVFTMPNADTGGRVIGKMISEYLQTHPESIRRDNLGAKGYFSLMKHAAAMVGNSSSGIIEAPSFRLPVVNIGSRQGGRVRAANVIDVGYGREEIKTGLRKAVDPVFRETISDLTNPYVRGQASEIIVGKLKSVALDDALIAKRFHDLIPFPTENRA